MILLLRIGESEENLLTVVGMNIFVNGPLTRKGEATPTDVRYSCVSVSTARIYYGIIAALMLA